MRTLGIFLGFVLTASSVFVNPIMGSQIALLGIGLMIFSYIVKR